jgi:hypothetical protein
VANALTKIWNVFTHPDESDQVANEVKAAVNTGEFRQSYTWKEFNSLQGNKQKLQKSTNNSKPSTVAWSSQAFRPLSAQSAICGKIIYPYTQLLTPWTIKQKNGHSTKPSDEATMHNEAMEVRFDGNINLTNTTIKKYIQQKYISGYSKPLFAHVYEPILGTIEVLIKPHHLPEALDLLKVI